MSFPQRKTNLSPRRLSRAVLPLAFAAQALFFAAASPAQDPIRVQSNEVLVPTVVFNKDLYAQLNKQEPHHRTSYSKLQAKNAKLWDDIVVKNLTARDFQLFEDGQEQKIDSVKLEPPAFRVVQDNLGKHPEIVGIGGGLWAYPDLPKNDMSSWLAWPQYVVAYVPPQSAAGSCHRIQVKTQRANLTVWSRSEYCNIPHPASDPLNGTELGNKLEKAAAAGTSNGIDLKLNVAAFSDDPETARVYVATGFPAESLRHEVRAGTLYATIGSLIFVYREDGSLAARFSDFACCDYGDQKDSGHTANETSAPSAIQGRALVPNRYETQFSLAPGKYVVRAAISDGVHFGVQEAPLTVDQFDRGKLSITGIVLARRVRRLPRNVPEAAERVADSYAPLTSKGVEFTPTSGTDFFRDDTLFAYFEINSPMMPGRSGAKILANLKIVDSKSGSAADTFSPVDTASYNEAGVPVIAVGRGIVLNHLVPGAYRLQAQASDADGQCTEWRSADFTVIEAPPLELGKAPSYSKKDLILPATPN